MSQQVFELISFAMDNIKSAALVLTPSPDNPTSSPNMRASYIPEMAVSDASFTVFKTAC